MIEEISENKANKIRQFAISDIHGNYKTFKKLLKKIGFSKFDELYLLGDIVNRGKNSAKILDYIINLKKSGHKILLLRGNHEQLLLNSKDKKNLIFILENYFSVDLLNKENKIKNKYLNLIEDSEFYVELDDKILVHAGLNLKDENIFENKKFMLYSRYIPKKTKNLNGKKLIHGHVPKKLRGIRKSIIKDSQIICIDNGCIYGTSVKGLGNLICLELNSMKITVQKKIDK